MHTPGIPLRFLPLLMAAALCFAQNACAVCVDGRHPGLAVETASSKYIIEGKVRKATDYRDANDPTGMAGTIYSINVIRAWKGNPSKLLRIDSENMSSRFLMDVGQRYLLFVVGSSTNDIVDACGNSGLLAERRVLVDALRADRDMTAVIYRLYKNYGWEALFALPADGGQVLGRPLRDESPRVLARYFDHRLVRLLVKEQQCLARHPGELCNLEFDPIFASQDPGASDLHIQSNTPRQVDVQFRYPSDQTTVSLVFQMARTKLGWRIDDIVYPGTQTSLKTLLAR